MLEGDSNNLFRLASSLPYNSHCVNYLPLPFGVVAICHVTLFLFVFVVVFLYIVSTCVYILLSRKGNAINFD